MLPVDHYLITSHYQKKYLLYQIKWRASNDSSRLKNLFEQAGVVGDDAVDANIQKAAHI
jgi:hypothetical protein